ncbi:MAG: hypothetical protein LBG60_15115 [Bifidobacteriaceae bacterium]|jgi:hypothetical protein|nr:hypothetical protein [Bifidobacteriaceae bacterium]
MNTTKVNTIRLSRTKMDKTRMNRTSLAAIGLITAVGLALAGCGQGEDVASLTGEGGKDGKSGKGDTALLSAEAEQGAAAEDFAACLKEAGVPHQIADWDESGQKYVDFSSGDQPMAMSYGGEYGSQWGGIGETDAEYQDSLESLVPLVEKYDPALAAQIGQNGGATSAVVITEGEAEAASPGAEEPEPVVRFLVVGQTDYTEAFVKCLDQSGYTEPVFTTDPADELKDKQRIAEATAEWANCARQNGYPDLKDPDPPVADNYETYPNALLPGDITEQALRDLLAACPNFDAAKTKAYEEAMAALGDNPSEADWAEFDEKWDMTQPSIDFDVPGLQGLAAGEEPDQETMDRLMALYEVLYEASNDYWTAQEAAAAE